MILHSYLYYQMDKPIWSDDKWQEVANKLRDLQVEYPQWCQVNYHDVLFKDWSGDTGMHLPKNEKVMYWAEYMLKVNDKFENA